MKLSELREFLGQKSELTNFKKEIFKEVSEYRTNLSKKGASASVVLDADIDLYLTKSHVAKLCTFYLNDDLSEYELYYIIDALLLSENVSFENEKLLDLTETMTDPFVNGVITKQVAREVLDYCIS